MKPQLMANPSLEEVEDDDEKNDEERLPPHEITACDSARTQMATFSMCEGLGRTLKGWDQIRVRNIVSRQTSDLSDNSLDGQIPKKIYNITYLRKLDVHGNRINGDIPSRLGNLNYMKYLDLSNNRLSGMIPSSLGNMTQLGYFNVSFNNIQGSIPNNSVMHKFGNRSFIGNKELCGPPLDTPCIAPSPSPSNQPRGGTRVLTVSAIIAIVAAAIIVVGVCIITLMNVRALRRKKTEFLVYESTPPSPEANMIIGKLVLFSKSLPSKYEDWEAGTKALLDKEYFIGVAAIGTIYKATFEGGLSIAVKTLETLGRIKVQEAFGQEISRLGNLRHPNLVAIQGYYWSSTMQLILSYFIPNGNLYLMTSNCRVHYCS